MYLNIIKKILTDEKYKQSYWEIDKFIYEENYICARSNIDVKVAMQEINAILKNKQIDEVSKSKHVKYVKYRVFPSIKKMEETLKNKKEQIYSALKLNKIKGENSDVVKALVLLEYLSKNTIYNMTTNEIVLTPQKAKMEDLEKHANLLIKQVRKEFENTSDADLEKRVKLVEKGYNIKNQFEHRVKDILNEADIKLTYDALIYKKGVCSNLSYAYSYLLKGLKLNSYCLAITNEEGLTGHMLNILKLPNKDKYYLVDVTLSNYNKHISGESVFDGFGIKKEEQEAFAEFEIISQIKKLKVDKKTGKLAFESLDVSKWNEIKNKLCLGDNLAKEKKMANKFIEYLNEGKFEISEPELEL